MVDANEAIERLCKLQTEVQYHLGNEGAADCFCGKSGFWGAEGYGGTFAEGYRNDGAAIEYIERTVMAALNTKGRKDDR